MVAKNDVTGDSIQSKVNSDAYKSNWDRIFSKPKKDAEEKDQKSVDEQEQNT